MVYIYRHVKYRSIICMKFLKEEEFLKDIDKIIRKYNLAGFTITIIHVDN